MAPAGAGDDSRRKARPSSINWSEIDTILLDMDGTLLDLNFDLHFWMEYLPLVYANKHNLTHQQSKDKIYPMLEANKVICTGIV